MLSRQVNQEAGGETRAEEERRRRGENISHSMGHVPPLYVTAVIFVTDTEEIPPEAERRLICCGKHSVVGCAR